MKISEVSKLVNIPSATLRYYEQIGLLDNIKKEHGIRNYEQGDLEKINFIICMKKAGFSLDSITQFIHLAEDKKQGEKKRLEMLLKQKDILLHEMKEKEATLSFLNYKIDLYTEKVEKKNQNKKEP